MRNIIGITGGIGSGKSVVSKLLTVMQYPVYDSDSRAKLLMHNSVNIRQKLTKQFGEAVYTNHKLNTPYLASIVFSSELHLQQLNAIVHPEVRADFAQWSREQQAETLFLESAILFEAGFHNDVDQIWSIIAPLEVRIANVTCRDSCTREQVEARIINQMSDQEKALRSDVTITNDYIHPLIPQIMQLLQR